jgi:DUF1009 family protein
MIGLIFGESDFPRQILKKIKNKKKYLIIDLTTNNIFKKNKNSYHVSVGQFGKIINILKEKKCKRVLFAGKVKKPNFSKLKLDLKGIYYIPRIIKKSKIGDVSILKEIINILKKEGIRTITSNYYTPELSLSEGVYSKHKPSEINKLNILKTIKVLTKSNDYSFSQGAVCRDNKIVAIEGSKGTDEMLKKNKLSKNKSKGILVKFPKRKQDMRIDLPTVGLDTLKQCKNAGINGIVLKHKKNIFLDKKKSIAFANKNKIFIFVK